MPLVVRSRDLLSTAGLVLAVLTVVVAPLLMGGVHKETLSVLVVLAFAGAGLHILGRARARRPATLSLLGLPFALGALLGVVALLPLPSAWLSWLSPESVEQRAFVTAILPDDAKALVRDVLAIEPGETALVVVRMIVALLVFFVVADACRHRRARRLAFRIVLVGALAVFVVSLLHRLANTDEIYGIYRAYGASILRGPMLNANHQARVFGAFSMLLLWRALVVRARGEQLWFAAVGALSGAGVFLTLSRGGMLAYVVVALFGAFVLLRTPPADEQDAETSAPLAGRARAIVGVELVALLGVALALFVAREAILEQLVSIGDETPETSKAMLYAPALALLDGYGRMGVTSGGFVAAYTSRIEPQTLPPNTVEFVENIVIQTLVDHGYAIGGALLLLAVFLLASVLLTLRARVQLVALPALVFLVTGDLFDFALETPAGLLLAAFSLGLLAAHMAEEGALARRVRAWGSLAIIGGLALVVALLMPRVFTETRRATDQALLAIPEEARRPALERAVALHPLDGHLCYALAVAHRRERKLAQAVDWANRALVLWPNHGGAHVEAARALAATGRLSQALIEYKLAWVSQSVNRSSLVREVALRTADVELRLSAIPEDDPAGVGQVCAHVRREQRKEDVRRCYEIAEERAPGRYTLELVESSIELEDGAQARAHIVDETKPPWTDGKGALLLVRTLALVEGLDAAWARSTSLVESARDPSPLLSWRLQAAVFRKDHAAALKALAALKQRARARTEIERLDRQEADLALAMGKKGDALKILRSLVNRRPRDVHLLLRTADLELSLGLFDDAKRTHARAIPLEPDNERVIGLGLRIEGALDRAREDRVKSIVEGRASAPSP